MRRNYKVSLNGMRVLAAGLLATTIFPPSIQASIVGDAVMSFDWDSFHVNGAIEETSRTAGIRVGSAPFMFEPHWDYFEFLENDADLAQQAFSVPGEIRAALRTVSKGAPLNHALVVQREFSFQALSDGWVDVGGNYTIGISGSRSSETESLSVIATADMRLTNRTTHFGTSDLERLWSADLGFTGDAAFSELRSGTLAPGRLWFRAGDRGDFSLLGTAWLITQGDFNPLTPLPFTSIADKSVVPEPLSMALFGLGAAGLLWRTRLLRPCKSMKRL